MSDYGQSNGSNLFQALGVPQEVGPRQILLTDNQVAFLKTLITDPALRDPASMILMVNSQRLYAASHQTRLAQQAGAGKSIKSSDTWRALGFKR